MNSFSQIFELKFNILSLHKAWSLEAALKWRHPYTCMKSIPITVLQALFKI